MPRCLVAFGLPNHEVVLLWFSRNTGKELPPLHLIKRIDLCFSLWDGHSLINTFVVYTCIISRLLPPERRDLALLLFWKAYKYPRAGRSS